MEAIFKELSPFESHRPSYMDDDQYSSLQQYLLKSPKAGDVISGTGGLRKLRWHDPSRSKGKRGGLRIIYYWYNEDDQFWMFTLYNKDEMTDLSPDDKKALKTMLEAEIKAR